MNLIDTQNSIVIDVTYNCNAKCHYCYCSKNSFSEKNNQPDNFIYVSKELLQHLKTERIVFSGAEPLIRQDLETIIAYYKQNRINSIVTLTNGILLNENRLQSLTSSGLTCITFSIDSFNEKCAFETRAYIKKQLEKIKLNFIATCSNKIKYNLEIGINVVISSANIVNNELENLVEFLNDYPIDWIKFQPIFENDFVNLNAKHLLLTSEHSNLIRLTGKRILDISKIETNNIYFWENLADILSGKELKGNTCGLDTRQAIFQNGKLKICSWIDYPIYDITKDTILKTQQDFFYAKQNCKTGTFCFCLQNLKQIWETK